MRIREYLSEREYPGRFLIAGTSEDSKPIVLYGLMGRSEKSRNRIFISENGVLRTETLGGDDDVLILYTASYRSGDRMIYANGSHGEEIKKALDEGKTLPEALDNLDPEPDSLRTPRIAAVINSDSTYELAIVRDGEDGNVERVAWKYQNTPGFGHIIHTYDEGEEVKPFSSDPAVIDFSPSLSRFADEVWNSLNQDNKVSLYVAYEGAERIFNKMVW